MSERVEQPGATGGTGFGRGVQPDWGGLRLHRECDWIESGGVVEVLMPRYGRGGLARALSRLLNPRPVRIRLDQVGAFVWSRCDGRHSMDQIAKVMREEFGPEAEPVEERLLVFVRRMLREKLVAISSP
jgi:hypothetical protein